MIEQPLKPHWQSRWQLLKPANLLNGMVMVMIFSMVLYWKVYWTVFVTSKCFFIQPPQLKGILHLVSLFMFYLFSISTLWLTRGPLPCVFLSLSLPPPLFLTHTQKIISSLSLSVSPIHCPPPFCLYLSCQHTIYRISLLSSFPCSFALEAINSAHPIRTLNQATGRELGATCTSNNWKQMININVRMMHTDRRRGRGG